MQWIEVSIRTIGMYAIVFVVMRLMGKREIGQLSVLDLVISVMIAEIAVIIIEDTDKNWLSGITPIVILLIIQIVTAIISMKSRKIRLLFDGKPTIVMANGKIYRDELKKQRYNLDDLLLQLRENGIASLGDVDFAILETSGKLSVIKKEDEVEQLEASKIKLSDKSVKKQQDLEEKQQKHHEHTKSYGLDAMQKDNKEEKSKIIPPGFRYEILPIPLIMDGKVQDQNLEKIEKTRFWLKNVIQERGVNQFKDVLLCTIDHKERIYVDASNRQKK